MLPSRVNNRDERTTTDDLKLSTVREWQYKLNAMDEVQLGTMLARLGTTPIHQLIRHQVLLALAVRCRRGDQHVLHPMADGVKDSSVTDSPIG